MSQQIEESNITFPLSGSSWIVKFPSKQLARAYLMNEESDDEELIIRKYGGIIVHKNNLETEGHVDMEDIVEDLDEGWLCRIM